MSNKKIYVVGCSKSYAVFLEHFDLTNQMDSADLVMFTGGEDISPHLYGDRRHVSTYPNQTRDMHEVVEFLEAKKRKIPMIGICRGAQLFCVMAGGKLVQDINHPHKHSIYTYDGNLLSVNSLHHQLQYPFNMPKENYEVLAWAQGLSKEHKNGDDKEMEMPADIEPEIVYYPKINALGIQHHPEMMYYQREMHPRMYKWINEQITLKLKV